MTTTKITAKLATHMYEDFDHQLSKALLRRDAFLNLVLSQEIHHLHEELAGKRLSSSANRYISERLDRLNPGEQLRQVSIVVSHETAKALRAAVKEHNLVRDAFLNRLIMLLRSSDRLLDVLGLPKRVRDVGICSGIGVEDMPTSPLRAIEATLDDPLYYLRTACKETHGCGLYMLQLPEQLTGLTCYMNDDDVPPRTPKEREATRVAREAIMNFESNLTLIKRPGA